MDTLHKNHENLETLETLETLEVNKRIRQVRTIFYQGIYNSQVQLSKYLTSEGFCSPTTGERIRCEKGLPLIINPFIGPEIDEIELFDNSILNWLNPFKVFSYIFTYLGHLANHITVSSINTSKKAISKSLTAHFINLPKFNFGQEGDMANHYNKYLDCIKENPEDDLILWGVSKGAATTMNALTKNNYDLSKIKLVILEGCFSSIEDVFKHWYHYRSYLDINFILAKLFLWLLSINFISYFLSYKPNPKFDPINTVLDIPHSVPVAFITCEQDIVVPCEQTIALYEKLKQSGHPNVHLLKLKKSRHHAYMFDDMEDRNAYEQFIMGLYARYGLI